jgi:hypothetical protein
VAGNVQPPRSKAPLFIGAGVVAVAAIVGVALVLGRRPGPASPSPTSPSSTLLAADTRELAYYLTVQKYRNGEPYGQPRRLAQEMLFGPDDGIRVTVASSQTGYLYVVNEGPDATGGITYNVLHPRAAEGSASAAFAAGQEVHLPSAERFFKFDAAQGTESLWLVFAKEPVPELEAVKGLANPVDRGVVKDPGQLQGLRSFLDRYRGHGPQAAKDEPTGRTVLRTSGALVSLLKLEHM